MELGEDLPELGGVLRRVLERDHAWRDDPVGQPFGRRLVGVLGVGDQLLEHRQGRDRPVPSDVLGRTGERGDDPQATLLGQVGGQLQVRVETGRDASDRP